MGIAPECTIVAIKVLDKYGCGNSADVLAGIQWVLDNKKKYNIKIANLSVGTSNNSEKDPLVKAVEALWDQGIVVNVAAGNNGPSKNSITSPGISKKVITVGTSDDYIKTDVWGNSLVNFSGRGPTSNCIVKPDVLAPGSNIISCLTSTAFEKNKNYKDIEIVDKYYIKLSGTSMATPMVSGAVALLLQKYKHLTPNAVKYMLKKSCHNLNYPPNQQGWGLINIKDLISEEGML